MTLSPKGIVTQHEKMGRSYVHIKFDHISEFQKGNAKFTQLDVAPQDN